MKNEIQFYRQVCGVVCGGRNIISMFSRTASFKCDGQLSRTRAILRRRLSSSLFQTRSHFSNRDAFIYDLPSASYWTGSVFTFLKYRGRCDLSTTRGSQFIRSIGISSSTQQNGQSLFAFLPTLASLILKAKCNIGQCRDSLLCCIAYIEKVRNNEYTASLISRVRLYREFF